MATIEKFSLNTLLDSACSNPDDFEAWHQAQADISNWFNADPETRGEKPRYKGWMLYTIDTHCRRFVVKAKRHPNGGYTIKDVITMDI